MDALARARRFVAKLLPSPVKLLAKAKSGLEKEQKMRKNLHQEVVATLIRMKEKDPGLGKELEKAYGFAVFPSVGRAQVVIGGSYGTGEVFKQGKLIGYAGLVQVTLGVLLGGQTFSELVLFENKAALDRFKRSEFGFAANASAVAVKAGAAATNKYKQGMQVFVQPEGGFQLQLDIGFQKMAFRPAALTRGKSAELERVGPRSSARRRTAGGSRGGKRRTTSERGRTTSKRERVPNESARRRLAEEVEDILELLAAHDARRRGNHRPRRSPSRSQAGNNGSSPRQ